MSGAGTNAEMGGAGSWTAPLAAQIPKSQSPAPEVQVTLEHGEIHPSSLGEASTLGTPARHDRLPGSDLKLIPRSKLVESGTDYAEILDELQIKPEHRDEVLTGILHEVRKKRMKNLQTGTKAMIRDLSCAFIRGYGKIIYIDQPEKWLVPEDQLRIAGKERLQFTWNNHNYKDDGPNAHFYQILKPLWWIMRDIIFEEKPQSKRPFQSSKRKPVDLSIQDDGTDSDYQGDNDTKLDTQPQKKKSLISRAPGSAPKEVPKVTFEQKQQQMLNRIEQEIDLSKRNGSWKQNELMTTDESNESIFDLSKRNGSWKQNRLTATEETDEAIFNLIVRLHDIRCASNPEVFARSWELHMARLDEIEDISDLRRGPARPEEQTPSAISPAQLLGQHMQEYERAALGTTVSSLKAIDLAEGTGQASPNVKQKNLANEPFNTNGPPSVLNQLKLSQTPLVPSTVYAYIMTAPPSFAYSDSSYVWPDAPVSMIDYKRFWDGIDQRAGVRNISCYVLSYCWNDVMRSIGPDDEARRYGFSVLTQDILRAAKFGVTRWRLKVLVLGESLGYQ